MGRHSFLKLRRTISLGSRRFLATQNYRFGEQTLLGYERPFRTLNGELLHLSHLRCLIVVEQAPFLTGSSQGLSFNAKSLNAPQTDSSASANGKQKDHYF